MSYIIVILMSFQIITKISSLKSQSTQALEQSARSTEVCRCIKHLLNVVNLPNLCRVETFFLRHIVAKQTQQELN